MLGFDALGRLALGQASTNIISAVGAASGVGAASAVGTGIKVTTTVTAAGVGAASATGTGIKVATTVTAAGIGAANASGTGIKTATTVTAAGVGTAAAVGVGFVIGVGDAEGIGAANGAGVAFRAAVGAASGSGAASAVSFYFGSTASVLKPDSDVGTGGWTNELGGAILFPSIDETTPSDDDYIISSPSPISDVCELNFNNPAGGIIAPLAVMYRYRKEGPGMINLHVRLMEGATEIASWDHLDISTEFIIANQLLNQTQVNAITNAANLTVELEAGV